MEENKYANLLSEENYSQIKNWLENPDAQEPEFAESFMTTIYFKYMNRTGNLTERRIRRHTVKIDAFPSLKQLLEQVENKIPAPEPIKPATISAINERPSEEKVEKEAEKEETLFTTEQEEQQRNSLNASLIGKAIRHCARLHDIKITDSHIQIILFVLYGFRLAKGYEDIFQEVPQMWTYGPVFASAFSSLKKTMNVETEYAAWKKVNQHDVKIGEHIINLVIELGERKVAELTKTHTALGTPWHQCRVMHPDKWGTKMDDETIKKWFVTNLEKSKQKSKK